MPAICPHCNEKLSKEDYVFERLADKAIRFVSMKAAANVVYCAKCGRVLGFAAWG